MSAGDARSLPERIAAWGPVRTWRRVLDAYSEAGGGLLAGGLTYSAIFALLPALLLLTAVLGFVVDDQERRVAIVRGIGQVLPPLEGLVATSLDQITRNAAGFGTLGLLGLVWGSSHFYGSLDDAIARIYRDEPRRGFVEKAVRGVLSIVLLVTVFVGTLALTGIASVLAEDTAAWFGAESAAFWRFAAPALAGVAFVAASVLTYRLIPGRPTPWSALWLPALVAGIALTLLTQLFSFIAPRLVGVGSVYVTFVAVFAAMIWLSTGFQILLIGAAWARDRMLSAGWRNGAPRAR
jgi:membrane protein